MGAHPDNDDPRVTYAHLQSGILLGTKVAVFFSAIALAAFLIGGNAALEAKGTPPIQKLLLVYIVGGVCGGTIAGGLSIHVKSDWSAALVGMLSILPASITWRLAKDGLAPWGWFDTTTQIVIAIVFGAGGGIITRKIVLERTSKDAITGRSE